MHVVFAIADSKSRVREGRGGVTTKHIRVLVLSFLFNQPVLHAKPLKTHCPYVQFNPLQKFGFIRFARKESKFASVTAAAEEPGFVNAVFLHAVRARTNQCSECIC